MKSIKTHIGIFGKRNVGKSSLINALAKQEIAIVSSKAGTTTDPVNKYIEIPTIGIVVFIDTAGLDDDEEELGLKRINKTIKVLDKIDIAILLFNNIFTDFEANLISKFKEKSIPYLLIHNKSDLVLFNENINEKYINLSTVNNTGIDNLISNLQEIHNKLEKNKSIIGDLVKYGDIVLLVTPIDIEAPEGRLILPQVQTIRDLLDNDCITIIVKEKELDVLLNRYKIKPSLVITDSQVFDKVNASIAKDIKLTSFSILFSRLKGDFNKYIEGTKHIANLKDKDNILILEACSHHLSCDDIGRVKIPRWLSNFTGKALNYEVIAGFDLPSKNIKEYSLIIQCGSCMFTRTQVLNRLKLALDNNIPITNYGLAIAYIKGIFNRVLEPFNIKEVEDYL